MNRSPTSQHSEMSPSSASVGLVRYRLQSRHRWGFNLYREDGLAQGAAVGWHKTNSDHNKFGDEGLQKIAQLPQLAALFVGTLRIIHSVGSPFTNEGAYQIAKLTHIGQLHIHYTPLRNQGLCRICSLRRLTEFDLGSWLLTQERLGWRTGASSSRSGIWKTSKWSWLI